MCQQSYFTVLVRYSQNIDYLRKFANEGLPTIGTMNNSPLALAGHVTVQITPRNFLVTALIRAIHQFELTCRCVTLFCNQSIRTCCDNKTKHLTDIIIIIIIIITIIIIVLGASYRVSMLLHVKT